MPRAVRVARSMDGIQAAGQKLSRSAFPVKRHSFLVKLIAACACFVVVAAGLAFLLVPQSVALATTFTPLWRPGTYLVLFENDAELRPTGGFIGSYAVVKVHDNRTFDYSINTNIYKIDNAYTADHSIDPPGPLKQVTGKWALRDSNWDIDFADAAKTIGWFYTEETGESVNGIVAVTAQAVRQLLAETGPLTLADGTRLGSSNFYDTLAYKIEKEYFFSDENRQENEPKQILTGLVPQLVSRLKSPINDIRMIRWLDSMLATKQIILNFSDDRQAIVESKGWADRVSNETQHYFALNNANIGGMKSSQHMSQNVQLTIETVDATHATYKISITRTHDGTGVWPDNKNTNLTRLVLPSGASLQSADIDGRAVEPTTSEQTNGRTSIGFWIDTEPGTVKQLQAIFAVPINESLLRDFEWQKQPGVASDDLTVAINGVTLLHGSIDRDTRVSLP